MGNSKGRDNAKKRARRRKKTERLALARKKKAGKYCAPGPNTLTTESFINFGNMFRAPRTNNSSRRV